MNRVERVFFSYEFLSFDDRGVSISKIFSIITYLGNVSNANTMCNIPIESCTLVSIENHTHAGVVQIPSDNFKILHAIIINVYYRVSPLNTFSFFSFFSTGRSPFTQYIIGALYIFIYTSI